jgi:hypothetical protein
MLALIVPHKSFAVIMVELSVPVLFLFSSSLTNTDAAHC